ncbi:hypothetical protein CTAYLR_005012 [Chrysophaeum taylorii]|uniref:subtilisin n=1 Tax=Chrysophaeum taylorii TaxID=2483200 RepID=A0AAD7UAP4_9STRA|nr:hypothetical protein CTAYLR_005012 [Chrysophaeum taylorii]
MRKVVVVLFVVVVVSSERSLFDATFGTRRSSGPSFAARTSEHREDLVASGEASVWLVEYSGSSRFISPPTRGLARVGGSYVTEFFGSASDAADLAERDGVKSVTPLAPEFRIERSSLFSRENEVTVDFFGDPFVMRERLEALGAFDIDAHASGRAIARFARDPLAPARVLAASPNVTRVGSQPRHERLNYEARWIVQSDDARLESTPLYDRDGLLGENIVVGCADSGLDYESCFFYDPDVPVNFDAASTFESTRHRKIRQYVGSADTGEGETGGHGTHVTGTIAGHAEGQSIDNIGGADYYVNDGMAPHAKLAFYDIGRPDESFLRVPAAIDDTILGDAYSVGAKIHSNSWGANVNSYLTNDQSIDSFSWENQDYLVFIAAGNSGPDPATLGSPATSKNGIAVGATENVQSTFTGIDDDGDDGADIDLASFSSRGPAFDGRIKPDLVGPGDSVVSANSLATPTPDHCAAARLSGTSMATPVLAGTSALLLQYFVEGLYPTGYRTTSREGATGEDDGVVYECQPTCFRRTCDFWNNYGYSCAVLEGTYGCDCSGCCTGVLTTARGDGFAPMGAALKALLVASARYLPGTEANRQGVAFPNQDQGFGLVVVDDAINPTGATLFVDGDFAAMPSISTTSETYEYTFEIGPFFVVEESTTTTEQQLRVVLAWHDPPGIVGATSALVNDLDLVVARSDGATFYPNAKGAPDDVNTVERVVIDGVARGEVYVARVTATAIAATYGAQPFSLVATGPFVRTPALYPDHAPSVSSAERGGADFSRMVVRGEGFTVGAGPGAANVNATTWTTLIATCDDGGGGGSTLAAASVVAATDTVFEIDLGADAAACDAVSVVAYDERRWTFSVDSVTTPTDQGAAAAAACYAVSDLDVCTTAALCQTTAASADEANFASCEPSEDERDRIEDPISRADDDAAAAAAGSGSSKKKKSETSPGVVAAAILVPLVLALILAACVVGFSRKVRKHEDRLYKASSRRVPRITSDASDVLVLAPRPSEKPPRISQRLPEGWDVYHDDETGNVFYVNQADGNSTWERPLV